MDERKKKEVVLAMLEGGRAVLSIPGAWHKGSYAADEDGNHVSAGAGSACKFCAYGILEALNCRVFGSVFGDACFEAKERLFLSTGTSSPIFVNDEAADVTPVLEMYDRAISRLKRELAG